MLDAKNFRDEFAHTILHKRDIFKEMKAAKKKAGKAGILNEEDIKNNAAAQQYEPKGIDKNTFDSVFNQYVDHVSNSKGKPGDARNPHADLSDKYGATDAIAEEEEEHMTEDQVDEAALAEAQKALMGRTQRPEMKADQKEMDRLCGLS